MRRLILNLQGLLESIISLQIETHLVGLELPTIGLSMVAGKYENSLIVDSRVVVRLPVINCFGSDFAASLSHCQVSATTRIHTMKLDSPIIDLMIPDQYIL